MAKTLVFKGEGVTTVASATRYYSCANTAGYNDTAEADSQITYRTAGTLSNLLIHVYQTGTSTFTLRTRINGANGNQVVSWAGGTGEFEDTSNTDTVAAGDEVNYSIVSNAGTEPSFAVIRTLFAANSNTVIRHAVKSSGDANYVNFALSSLTYYLMLAGRSNSVTIFTFGSMITEAWHKQNFNSAGTLKNLFIYVPSNTRSDTTTIRSRRNSANGNLSISVGASSTGIFEDTTNSDTVSVNDYLNYSITTGAGDGSMRVSIISAEFETTNNKFHALGGTLGGFTQTANTTRYPPIGGHLVGGTTESFTQTAIGMSATASNLFIYISFNGVTATSTHDLRKNGDSTAVTISIDASTTGYFEDSSNTATFVAADTINGRIALGATGTSMTYRCGGLMLENTNPVSKIYMFNQAVNRANTY